MKLGGYLSKYLKAEDFPQPELYTIERVDEEEMQDGGKKLVVYFTEVLPGVVLGKTTIGMVVEALALTMEDDTDQWIGSPIVVYNDPSVMYQGKKTGGIRFRAPKVVQAARNAPKKIVEAKVTAATGKGFRDTTGNGVRRDDRTVPAHTDDDSPY